jgi:effector-binding domain-containing protein
MMLGKVILKKSFDLGLNQLKSTLESMPFRPGGEESISVATLPSMHVLLADGAGTMEEISVQLTELYTLLYETAGEQGLEVTGVPFVDYLDYDETTGFSNYRAGIQVNGMGRDAGRVKAEHFPETRVVQTIHKGTYETSDATYEAVDAYIQDHGLEIKGDALEFYQVGAMNEPDASKWETLVAFPLK